MEEISALFLCPICLSDFNSDDHLPKILSCGHNLCAGSIPSLFDQSDNSIKCPVCRKRSNYERVDDIPTDCKLVKMM